MLCSNLPWRSALLALTILLYGACGYPTPDQPRITELLIGLGLISALGLSKSAFLLFQSAPYEPLWVKPARLLLLFGMSVPIMTGLLHMNDPSAMLRDIIPFLFLLLPLFAFPLIRGMTHSQQNILCGVILTAGMIFALRGLYIFKDGIDAVHNLDAMYLANAPTVLYAALFLSGYCLLHFRLRAPLLPLLAGGASLIPMMAMGELFQRASFGAITLSLCFFMLIVLRRNLFYFLTLCGVLIAAILIFYDDIYTLLHALFEKNRLVGSNTRFDELQTVWEVITIHYHTTLFGLGWGASFHSPAVADLNVNYTHSLISATLLKNGLIGLTLVLGYIGTLFLRFPALYRASPLLCIALFWPLFIDIFLYASYKSLDFGLILMLIACYGLAPLRTEHKKTGENRITDQSHISAADRPDGASAA